MAQRHRSTADLYDEQIRPLPLRDRLDLAQRILAEIAAAAEPEGPPRSLLEFEGLGAELWDGVDAQEYVDQIRREWDERH
jgi:hypothetical protein